MSRPCFFLELNDVPIGPYAVGRNVVGSTEDLRGDIAEVLVYDRRLASLEERQRVFQYLANKWSVAMPKAANTWTRVGPLGTTPKQINAQLPLSDQGNVGQWRLDPRFCDDFDGATLDASRWHVNNAKGTESLGRKPALFKPDNAYLSDGHLNIVFRKDTLPQKYVRLGYEGYSSAMVRTIERSFFTVTTKPGPNRWTRQVPAPSGSRGRGLPITPRKSTSSKSVAKPKKTPPSTACTT